MKPLDKVKEAAIWVQREENLLTAGKMRLGKTVREAHASGEPIAAIARAAGVSRPTIYSILRED